MSDLNTNEAPFPEALDRLVQQLGYKANWSFDLADSDRGQGSSGLTLTIHIITPDSYNPGVRRGVIHYMPVPPAAYDERSWTRWLLDQILLVEQHEACEFFQIDGGRPFAPNHGPGRNPYSIMELGTAEDVATSFRGERSPP